MNVRDCSQASFATETAAERDRLRQTVIDGEKRCIELLQERDRLKVVNEGLVEALIEALIDIDDSGSCYCAQDVDGQRLGGKCPICVARAALAYRKKD